MFHNLLKQFRKSFEKRPILRKLLKVLNYALNCAIFGSAYLTFSNLNRSFYAEIMCFVGCIKMMVNNILNIHEESIILLLQFG